MDRVAALDLDAEGNLDRGQVRELYLLFVAQEFHTDINWQSFYEAITQIWNRISPLEKLAAAGG